MVDKLVKEFEKIRVSLNKSKKLILADIDKIDEKYRKLAQEEKKSLTESLSILNDQLKYYDKMLEGQTEDVAEDSSADETETEVVDNMPSEEEAVVDTVYPENNIQEEVDDVFEQKEDAPAEDGFKEVTESTWEEAFGDNMAIDEPSEETAEVQDEVAEEAAANQDTSDINEEWPMPEEWK